MFVRRLYSATLLGVLAAAGTATAQETPGYAQPGEYWQSSGVVEVAPLRDDAVPHVALVQDAKTQTVVEGSTTQAATPGNRAGAAYNMANAPPPRRKRKRRRAILLQVRTKVCSLTITSATSTILASRANLDSATV